MSGLVQGLVGLLALVTVSAVASAALIDDVRSLFAVLAATWFVAGLTCLLVAARRRCTGRSDAT